MRIFCLIIPLFLIGCGEGKRDKNFLPTDGVHVSAGDTICTSDTRFRKLDKIEFIDACHIVYTDSLSHKRMKDMGAKKVDAEYNYYTTDEPLRYSQRHDTIEIKYCTC